MKASGKKDSKYPGWHLWEGDTIWTAYRLDPQEAEECLPAIGKYSFMYNARLLGRRVGRSIIVLLNFDTLDNQTLFLAAMGEEKLAPKAMVATRYDIEHAWPLAQILSPRLNRLMEDDAVMDPAMVRCALELLEQRDQEAPGDYMFSFSAEMKDLLAKLRKSDV